MRFRPLITGSLKICDFGRQISFAVLFPRFALRSFGSQSSNQQSRICALAVHLTRVPYTTRLGLSNFWLPLVAHKALWCSGEFVVRTDARAAENRVGLLTAPTLCSLRVF